MSLMPLVYVLLGLAFFALTLALVRFSENLRGNGPWPCYTPSQVPSPSPCWFTSSSRCLSRRCSH